MGSREVGDRSVSAERSVSEVFQQRDRSLNTESRGSSRSPTADVGCEMALELNLKAAEARAHKQTTAHEPRPNASVSRNSSPLASSW